MIDLPSLAQIDFLRLFSIVMFFIVGGFTPGPNNIMVMASAARFGYRRTLPHILGIGFGFTFMSGIVAYGLGSVFQQLPWLHLAVKILGSLYLCYLAWRIYQSTAEEGETSARAHPFTFLEASLFQWVNPKAWQIAATATAMFTHPGAQFYHFEIISMLAIIFCLSFPSASAWALGGMALRRVLQTPRNLRLFNHVMVVLLLLSMALSWV